MATEQTPLLPTTYPINESKEPTDPFVAFCELTAHHFNDFISPIPHKSLGGHIKDWGTRGVAAVVGGLAAYYYVPGAKEAAEFLCKTQFISELELCSFLNFMFPTSSGTLNTLLGAQCLIETAELLKRSNHLHQYLSSNDNETEEEKRERHWRYLATGVFLLGSLMVPFSLTIASSGLGMAIGTTLANGPVNLVGIHNLFKQPMSPAKKVLLNHINKIRTDLRNWYDYAPQKVLDIISNFQNKVESAGEDVAKTFTALQAVFDIPKKLLSYNTQETPKDSETLTPEQEDNLILIIKKADPSFTREAFATITKYICIASIGGYVWSAATQASGVTSNSLAKNALGAAAAFISLVPLFGLSKHSSEQVGSNLFSGKKEVADVVLPKISFKGYEASINTLLQFAVGVIAMFSGGTNMFVNNKFVEEFPLISQAAKAGVSGAYMGDAALGAATTNFYYSAKLVAEVVEFFAQHFGSEEIKRYMKFEMFLQKLYKTFETTDEKKLHRILTKLMAKESKTADHLDALFEENLYGRDRNDFYEKTELAKKTIKIERHESNVLTPGLRHRKSYTFE